MTESAITISLVDGISAGLRKISGGVNGLGAGFVKLNSAVELFQKGVGFAIDIAKGIGDLITPAREAESALNRVGVATNATAAELEALRVKANKVAFDLRVPFNDVAAGAEQLARDGATASEVLANLETVTAFAGATSLKTADAAGQLSDILDGYGEKIGNIGGIGDGIVATARAAGVGVAELAEGVKKLGPTARDANVDVSTITALLGVLAENGRGGGRAVKELETILIALKDPASKTGEVLKTLGLDAGNLGGVIQRLSTDSGAAEKVLATLGDKPAIALKLLLSEGGGALTELTGIINNSGGASKEAADKLGSTFDGAVERIQIAVEALKASFFTPLLAPFSTEIDALSEKIQAFSQTKDFELLRTAVGDFVTKALAELTRLGTEFDARQAIAGIKEFVQDAGDALSGLKTTVDTLKNGFALVGVTFNAVQVGAATVVSATASAAAGVQDLANKTGLAGEEGQKYSDILHGVADSAADSAVQNDRQRQSYEDLLNPADAAATAIKGVAVGHIQGADAALKNANATQQAANVLPKTTSLFDGLKGAIKGGAESAVVFAENVVGGVQKPLGPVEALRKRISDLNLALSKAFAEGADTTKIVADLNTTTAELDKLTGSARPAAEAVKDLGDKANESAPQVSTLGSSASDASDALDSIQESSAATAKGVGKLAGAVADASKRFVFGSVDLLQFARDANKAGLYFEGLTATIDAYGKARSRAADITLKALQAEVAALDPVQKRLEELRKQFPEATKDVLSQIQQLEEARDRLKGVQAGGNIPTQGAGDTGTTERSGLGPIKVEFSNKQSDGMPINLSPEQLSVLSNNIMAEIARRRFS